MPHDYGSDELNRSIGETPEQYRVRSARRIFLTARRSGKTWTSYAAMADIVEQRGLPETAKAMRAGLPIAAVDGILQREQIQRAEQATFFLVAGSAGLTPMEQAARHYDARRDAQRWDDDGGTASKARQRAYHNTDWSRISIDQANGSFQFVPDEILRQIPAPTRVHIELSPDWERCIVADGWRNKRF